MRLQREPDHGFAEQIGDDGAGAGRREARTVVDPGRVGDDAEGTRRVDHQVGVARRHTVGRQRELRIGRRLDLLDEVDQVEFDLGRAVVATLDDLAGREDGREQEEQADHAADRGEEAHAEDLPHGAFDATASRRATGDGDGVTGTG